VFDFSRDSVKLAASSITASVFFPDPIANAKQDANFQEFP
jgi:hypothetical protein